VHPNAADLALEPRHVMGLSLEDLSFSQLEVLEETHMLLAKQVEEVRIETAHVQERAKMEEDLRRDLHISQISSLDSVK